MKNQNMKKAEKDKVVKELVIGKLKELMVDNCREILMISPLMGPLRSCYAQLL